MKKEDDYVDLVVTFTLIEGGDVLKNTPLVRVHFK
jgi:hypothetical protein